MANTFKLITSVELTSTAAQIEFTGIPGTFTDLLLKVSSRGTSNDASNGYYYDVTFNNTSANRTGRYIRGKNGTITDANSTLIGISAPSDATSSLFSVDEIYISNYLTSGQKVASVVSLAGDSADTVFYNLYSGGVWNDSSVITSIKLVQGGGSFAAYSSAYLYGISNA